MTMIEKVALALAEYHGDDEGSSTSPHYREMARAAIDAMRELTDAMLSAYDATSGRPIYRNAYSSMIDAALDTSENP